MTFPLRFSSPASTPPAFSPPLLKPGLIFNRSNKFDFRALSVSKSERIQIPKKRRRLDEICLERFQQYSRTYIQSWIMQGKVFVDGKVVNKAGTHVSDKSVVEIKAVIPKYVCRAGHKLEVALKEFNVDCAGKMVLDSGLLTGGSLIICYKMVPRMFMELILAMVSFAPDCFYGIMILTTDLLSDVVMPAVVNLMKMESMLITLIKPQFEARRSQVGGGGIVRDPQVHQEGTDGQIMFMHMLCVHRARGCVFMQIYFPFLEC